MTAASLADLLTDNAAEVDELVDNSAPTYTPRVRELQESAAGRDPDLWEDACNDIGISTDWAAFTLSDLNEFPVAERDLAWQAASAMVFRCAEIQAFTEDTLRPLLTASEGHAQRVDRASPSDVRAVAKVGISKEAFEVAKEKRRASRTNLPG